MKLEYAKAFEQGLVRVGTKVLTYPNHVGICHEGIVKSIEPYMDMYPDNLIMSVDLVEPINGNIGLELCNGRYTRRFESSLDIQYVIIDEE